MLQQDDELQRKLAQIFKRMPQIGAMQNDPPTAAPYKLPSIDLAEPTPSDGALAATGAALPAIVAPEQAAQVFTPQALPTIGALQPALDATSLAKTVLSGQPANAPTPLSTAEEAHREALGATATDNDKGWKRKLGAILREGFIGAAAAARNNPNGDPLANLLGGLIGGGAGYALDPTVDERRTVEKNIAQTGRMLQTETGLADAQLNRDYKQSQMADAVAKREFERDVLAERKEDRLRKVEDRTARVATNRMNTVAKMLQNLPAYDPANPKFSELTKALGEVNLPITAKDAKKKIDLKQDQRTGEWTTILTDPVTGNQETRSVMKNGEVFKSTPTVVMQGELGLLRQDDQQAFTADQNAQNRQQQLLLQTNAQSFAVSQTKLSAALQAERDAKTNEQRVEAQRVAQEARKEIVELQAERQKTLQLLKGN